MDKQNDKTIRKYKFSPYNYQRNKKMLLYNLQYLLFNFEILIK